MICLKDGGDACVSTECCGCAAAREQKRKKKKGNRLSFHNQSPVDVGFARHERKRDGEGERTKGGRDEETQYPRASKGGLQPGLGAEGEEGRGGEIRKRRS